MDINNPINKSQGSVQSPLSIRKSVESKKSNWKSGRWFRFLNVALGAAILVILVGIFFGVSSLNNNQNQYLDKNNLQAVFLNTGQVYFGNVSNINKDYLVLNNIFYLQTTSSSQSSSTTSINLIKLGCEIHAPLDRMVISQNEVTFWENLSPSGQVAKAVKSYWQNNPNGQKCSDQSSAGSTNQANPQSSKKQ